MAQSGMSFADADDDGIVSADEVLFNQEDSRSYTQGDGLIQVVSGVGGHSLRFTEYSDPYIASAYSQAKSTGPIEYGFAQFDVSESELKVSYIAAGDGRIVGDTNKNGEPDQDEPWFGSFSIERHFPIVEPHRRCSKLFYFISKAWKYMCVQCRFNIAEHLVVYAYGTSYCQNRIT